jgi:hypothetical protein
VKRGLRLLAVATLAPLATGCFFFPPVGVDGVSSQDSGTSAAAANVRSAIPAIEAYYADNLSYEGATYSKLKQYDPGLPLDVRVVEATQLSYCIDSTIDGFAFNKAGPVADILPGRCPGDPPAPPPTLPEPARTLHGAVRMMLEFHAQHGTYEGITARDLEWKVRGLDSVRIVEATKDSFCLESTLDGQTWVARQSGDVGVGSSC